MSKPPQNDGERIVWAAVYAAALVAGHANRVACRISATPSEIGEASAELADHGLDELRRLAGFKESSAYSVIGDPERCYHRASYPAWIFGTEKEPCVKCGRYYLDG